MKELVKQAKGITLIALVVTIVILLILTGITLKLSIGDNSILARATKAAKDTKRAQAQDQIGLKFGESQIDIDENFNKNHENAIYNLMEKIKAAGVIGINDIEETNKEGYNSEIITLKLKAQMEKDNSFYNADVTVTETYNYRDDSDGPTIDNIDYENFEQIDSVGYDNRIFFDYFVEQEENDYYVPDDYETDIAKMVYRDSRGGGVSSDIYYGPSRLSEDTIFYNKIDGGYYEYVDCYSNDKGISFLKKINVAPMIIKVNSGDSKNVILNLGAFKGFIDWGDGQKDQIDELVEPRYMQPSCLPKKIATIGNNFKIAEKAPSSGEHEHTYADANKEYEITVNGICPQLDISYSGYYDDSDEQVNDYEKITSIEDWGSLGSVYVGFERCQNLASIPSPTEETFKFTVNMEGLFANCKALTSIPDDLFKWNIHTMDYSGAFYQCENLTAIPAELFDTNIDNIVAFCETFAGCTNLTGEAPRLWEHVKESNRRAQINAMSMSNDDYEKYRYGVPNGEACFAGCTNLSNYDEIPEYWADYQDE